MPELPEVETVRLGLEPVFVGNRVAKVHQRRADLRIVFPDRFAERIEGQRVVALRRRAKYLVAELEDGTALIMHLGMSGRFTIYAPEKKALRPGVFAHAMPYDAQAGSGPHDHVVFLFDDGTKVVYTDHRRFGLMTLHEGEAIDAHPLFQNLGIEPLGNHLNADYLNKVLKSKRTPIKAALLDQRLVAGIGNIYACEALYYAGISPRRMAYTVPGKRAERLAMAIRDVLRRAIEAGGSSLRDYAHADGELGYFQTQFAVYGREDERCLTKGCGNFVKRIVQSNRSSFFCSSCQR